MVAAGSRLRGPAVGPFRRAVNVNRWLVDQGYMKLKDGEGRSLFADVDWSQTRAYAVGFTSIYLNLAGRESGGIVRAGAFHFGIAVFWKESGIFHIVHEVVRQARADNQVFVLVSSLDAGETSTLLTRTKSTAQIATSGFASFCYWNRSCFGRNRWMDE